MLSYIKLVYQLRIQFVKHESDECIDLYVTLKEFYLPVVVVIFISNITYMYLLLKKYTRKPKILYVVSALRKLLR